MAPMINLRHHLKYVFQESAQHQRWQIILTYQIITAAELGK